MRRVDQFSAVKPLPASGKVGIIFLGFVVAFAVAWVAVELRQLATQGPDAQAASGMYAGGDMILGIGVFGMCALLPVGLALYWLRSVARFWSTLVSAAMIFAVSGFLAVLANMAASPSTGGWIFLAQARVGLMPLTSPALLLCALFAPRPRDRWLLLAAAVTDAAIFGGILFVKVVLPRLFSA